MGEIFAKYLRLVKFGAVGCVNTAVDFLAFSIASSIIGMLPEMAQAVGYCCGIICSFILNRLFTFNDAEKETKKGEATRALRFVIINGVSLAFSVVAMAYLTHAGIWEYLAKAIITVITMAINYVGYKIFVFKIKGERA